MNKIKTYNTGTNSAVVLMVVLSAIIFISCKKYLPEDRETVGADSQFTKTIQAMCLMWN